jgi:hypothetical protein
VRNHHPEDDARCQGGHTPLTGSAHVDRGLPAPDLTPHLADISYLRAPMELGGMACGGSRRPTDVGGVPSVLG